MIALSGHLILVTDDLDIVGQDQNLQKNAHFCKVNISKKNSQCKFSLTAIGNQKLQMVSEFGSITAITIVALQPAINCLII